MGRMISGNRGGARLSADRRSFAAGIAESAPIAILSRPFGPGTVHSAAGTTPGQLALSGGAILRGAAAPVGGGSYDVKIRATSADGRREIAETLTFACTPATAAKPVDVLVLIGDSNARGSAADDASLAYAADPLVTTWNGSAFVPYAPGTRTGMTVPAASAGSEGKVGCEMQFARAWRAANPDRAIAIVKVGKAGSIQGYNNDPVQSWEVARGNLVAFARNALTAALANLTSAGHAPSVLAVIDILGTNDAADATLAAGVQAAKAAMHADIRANWPVSPSTMLIVQRMTAGQQAHAATVRSAQAAVANASPGIFLTDSDGPAFTKNPGDATHYDLAGLIALGNAHHAMVAGRMNRRILSLGAKARFYVNSSDQATVAGGLVTALADSVGDRGLTQGTVARQPGMAAGGIDFDGANDELIRTGSNGFGTGDGEGFAIVASDSTSADTGARVIYARGGGVDANDLRLGRTLSGGVSRFRLRVGVGNSAAYAVVDGQATAEGGPQVVYWRLAGNSLFVSVNGQAEQNYAMPAPPAIGDAYVGIGAANGTQSFDGRIRLVGETAPLTPAERTALMADLLAEAAA